MWVLVTGGAGYIGSHTVVELLDSGVDVVIFDNFSNSSPASVERIREIVGGRTGVGRLRVCEGDIRSREQLDLVFNEFDIQSVIHFAGLKAVGESNDQPLRYYQNNVAGTLCLTEAMAQANVFSLVFSSSATVYGEVETVPISESVPTGAPTNPYGRSKLIVEEILKDLRKSDDRWRIALLRYFNPVGAHKSGLIGEDPQGIPNNLVPFISQVAVGRRAKLSVFGSDYPTKDGTGVRDYIHVVDLALGHLAALNWLEKNAELGIWNLGTGTGYSVLEMIRIFEQVSGREVNYEIVDRRPGDIAECWADPRKAYAELGWRAKRDLTEMLQDTWRWQAANPEGFETKVLAQA
ncbi:MAG: UDP-glucose 4-epimerase GalE [Oceanospirillaceae bacterium]|nr:UDP-glucose 4-epimerase GalE [Oceanospirillaceae bacterium]